MVNVKQKKNEMSIYFVTVFAHSWNNLLILQHGSMQPLKFFSPWDWVLDHSQLLPATTSITTTLSDRQLLSPSLTAALLSLQALSPLPSMALRPQSTMRTVQKGKYSSQYYMHQLIDTDTIGMKEVAKLVNID